MQAFITGVKELTGIPDAGVLNTLQMTDYSQFVLASNGASKMRREHIGKWIQDDLKKGASALHKVAARTTKQPPKLLVGHLTPTCPLSLAEGKRKLWEGHWKCGSIDPQFDAAWKELQQQAKEELIEGRLSPILNKNVWTACKKGPGNTQADHCTTRILPRSGYEDTDKLGAIIRHCKDSLTWPAQELCNMVALQPKPDSDEDRPTTLAGSGLYRTWSKIRRPYMVEQC